MAWFTTAGNASSPDAYQQKTISVDVFRSVSVNVIADIDIAAYDLKKRLDKLTNEVVWI